LNGPGGPDLRLDSIFRGAEERLDPQVLFDPFEEEFDLPAVFIKLGNCHGRQCEIIG
jgi:hypothetical protein